MKYYVKEKSLSFLPKFSIFDEMNNELFYVDCVLRLFGNNYKAYDPSKNELFEIKQDVANFFPKIDIIFASAKTGEGIPEIAEWFLKNVKEWIAD